MKNTRSFLSLAIVFGVGFIAGVLFSAWKLDTGHFASSSSARAPEQTQKQAIDSRISGLEKMLAKTPDNVNAWIQLGNDYFDKGNHQKAARAYNKALELDPKNAAALTDLGISYRRLGKPQEAVKTFKRAIQADPSHPAALFNMGIVYRDDLKDFPAALKAWEEFLQKAGDAPHSVMVRPWVEQLKKRISGQKAAGESESAGSGSKAAPKE